MNDSDGKYRPVNECFKTTNKVRASHLLYEDFLEERTDVSKFIFYLWLFQNDLGAIRGKDKDGNAGYALEFIQSK